jgi:hypothetical protein
VHSSFQALILQVRLQNQRTLSIFSSGAGYVRATRKNGMLAPFKLVWCDHTSLKSALVLVGELNHNFSTDIRCGTAIDFACVGFCDDLIADRHAHSSTFANGFSREERIEDML